MLYSQDFLCKFALPATRNSLMIHQCQAELPRYALGSARNAQTGEITACGGFLYIRTQCAMNVLLISTVNSRIPATALSPQPFNLYLESWALEFACAVCLERPWDHGSKVRSLAAPLRESATLQQVCSSEFRSHSNRKKLQAAASSREWVQ